MATQVWDSGSKDRDRSAFDELTEISQRIQTFANASGAAVGLRVGNSEEIICCARTGPSARDVGAIMGVAGSFASLCIKSGKGLLSDDTETDTRVDLAAVRALGIRSIVVTPVKQDSQVVGVLAVFSPFPNAFTGIHLAVMRTSADQIAAFLRKSRQISEQEYEPAPNLAPVAVSKAGPAPAEPTVPPVVVAHPVTTEHIPVVTPAVAAPAPAPKAAPLERVVPPAAVHPATIEAIPARPVMTPPMAAKAAAAGAEAHAPISAPAESKHLRDMPRAIENSAAFWSGSAPASTSVTSAPAIVHSVEAVAVLAEDVKPARMESSRKHQLHHDSLSTLSAISEQNKKPRTNLILAAVAAVAVIAGGTFLFLKLHKPAPQTVAQHLQEASSQPTPVQPTVETAGSTSISQPSSLPSVTVAASKDSAPSVPAASATPAGGNNASSAPVTNSSADGAKKSSKTEKPITPQPEKRAPETVALATSPSKITGPRPSDNGQQDTAAAPTLSVGGGPALGNLSAVSSSSVAPAPTVVRESRMEPVQTLKTVSPVYPAIARARGITRAEVVVSARVGKDGKVSNVRLVSGDPIFLDAVATAVKQWQFKPAQLNGQPIEQDHQIKVKFGQ